CMDQNIGKILKTLEKNNAIDNTVIIFISDNGACAEQAGNGNINTIGTAQTEESYRTAWANASNTPFTLYKSYVHEGGISSPMIVHWPKGLKVEKGSFCPTLGHIIDIMPTCLELAGAVYPEKFERNIIYPLAGKSLVPTFTGNDVEREALYFEHEVNRAIRKGNWKLVSRGTFRPPYTSPWELYDLEQDRTETTNLAEQHPEIVEELAAMWDSWAQENDVYPLDGRGWNQKIRASIR
ncbi:MAG: sulfatase-like hydrolase/transferase, partial [Sedimentisphaerales bacterium]|nr:sulfatase-like hydrolase/transferase [Sedimentisphaerales bacterium]